MAQAVAYDDACGKVQNAEWPGGDMKCHVQYQRLKKITSHFYHVTRMHSADYTVCL